MKLYRAAYCIFFLNLVNNAMEHNHSNAIVGNEGFKAHHAENEEASHSHHKEKLMPQKKSVAQKFKSVITRKKE